MFPVKFQFVVCLLLPALAAPSWGEQAPPAFDQTLGQGAISFRVQSSNDSAINQLTITPAGLAAVNRAEAAEIDGTVTAAEIGDLNADGYPELYVYVSSAGSGSYGTLVAFAVNNGKSMSSIYLPPIEDDPQLAEGYMGHDEFAVVENRLVRRFPIYLPGDTNAAPSGKLRQLQYELSAGEAGWVLKLDRVIEF